MNRRNIIQVLESIIEKDEADGCRNCAFEDVDEWNMPCAKCSRNCKDYYRYKSEVE